MGHPKRITIEVNTEVFANILRSALTHDALVVSGVDNWEFYDEAISELNNTLPTDISDISYIEIIEMYYPSIKIV